jgi:hypothetical protein
MRFICVPLGDRFIMVIMALCHEVREPAPRRLLSVTHCVFMLIVSLFKVKTVIMLEE